MQKPSLETLQAIDLSPLEHYLAPQRISEGFFTRPAGMEHYRLLAWISTQISNSTITEIGTLDGMGLTALCYNPSNKVVSWDIKDCSWKGKVPRNGERKIVHDGYMKEVIETPIIFYDGAHDGEQEQKFFDNLIELGYKGVIFWDDIHLNAEMERFWTNIIHLYRDSQEISNHPLKDRIFVEDWTDVGHNCGTGMVILI